MSLRHYFLKYWLILTLVFVLFGCVTTPSDNTVALSNTAHLRLTSPPNELISTFESQLIEINFNKQEHRFIAQVEYSVDSIVLAAMSLTGAPLFDFTWQAQAPLSINQYVPLPEINIHHIIADIQLCHWPLAEIASAISGNSITVTQQEVLTDPDILWQRIISEKNSPIISIQKTINGIQLNHILHNYQIHLTTLNKEAL